MARNVKRPVQVSFADLCGVLIPPPPGGNFAPVISSGFAPVKIKEISDKAAGENTAYHARSATLKFTDSNAADVHNASFVPLGGGYRGTFSLGNVDQAANCVKWTFKVRDDKLDSLQQGQTLTQNYRVTISDGHGGTTSKIVTVVLTGTNDAPEIQSFNGEGEEFPPFGSVTEDVNPDANGDLTDSGTFTFDDVDLKDTHSVSVTKNSSELPGAGGTLTATITDPATGAGNGTIAWNYTVDNGLVQYLDEGEQAIETFTIKVNDGHGGFDTQIVTVVVNGKDDPVTISGLGLAAPEVTVFEKHLADGSDPNAPSLGQSGSFSFSSADGLDSITINGDPVFAGAVFDTPLGMLTITGYTTTTNANGEISGGTVTYEYLLEENSLDHGQPGADAAVLDSFTVVVTDTGGSTESAVIDVNIVDDVPAAGVNPVIHVCSLEDDDDDDDDDHDHDDDDDDEYGYGGYEQQNPESASQSNDNSEYDDEDNGPEDDDDDSSGLAVVTGILAHNFGADQAGEIALTGVELPATGGFTQSGTGTLITVQQNGIDVFLVELTDQATGSYQITQLAPLCHDDDDDDDDDDYGSEEDEGSEYQGSGTQSHSLDDGIESDEYDDSANEDEVAFTLHYTVTDADGDMAVGSAVIAICCSHEDDEDEDETSENSGGYDNAVYYVSNNSVLMPTQAADEPLPYWHAEQQSEISSLFGDAPPESGAPLEQSVAIPEYNTQNLEAEVFV